MFRLVQLVHPDEGRRVAVVEEPKLHLLPSYDTVFELADAAMKSGKKMQDLISLAEPFLEYEPIHAGRSDWKLLPAFDHPLEPSRLHVTGTGLTHKASAENRQAMHGDPAHLTDSMKMYRIGLEGGRPQPGCIGAPPEWFYKGTGHILRAHLQPLVVPEHGEDGGEEAEIAGCYIIGSDGTPYRVGLAQANEFSDHVLEARNYLYLAQSKLRQCALGPELIVDGDFSDVPGEARILRGGHEIWSGRQASGEKWMCHTQANLEHHHFKHAEHRRPGDVHIHFFGADLFSFKDRLKLADGDVMEIAFKAFGRPLRNPIRIDGSAPTFVAVKAL
jgi:hypothetical protein